MQITINFHPKDLIDRFDLVQSKLEKNLNLAVQAAAILVQNRARLEIQTGGRTGRIYRRRSVTHQASAPGEYPKSDTGRLASSIRTDFSFLNASVGSDLNYSTWLETGTNKMAARPWLGRTLEEQSPKIKQIIDDAIRNSVE